MIKTQQNTNFSNSISVNKNSALNKVQSPIQLIGSATFGSTEQRAFFVEGGDAMSRLNESQFSGSTFPMSLFGLIKARFITTQAQKNTIYLRKANFMFVGNNSSTIEYGIYIVTLTDPTTDNQTMSTKLFSTTIQSASGEIRQSTTDFTQEIEQYNNVALPYVLFPYVQNPNGTITISFCNYTLF